ncbi:transcriptional regulator [Comamonas aquatica DA1877]|uniref:Transcriptional regulator n=1 Tax=Comamonas aquatica DA1877 TaxID=1457173 RepID=A0A014MDS5_9BURK|nr:LysR family transcriptional regulator [Comamonas aquatica]EXU79921.1 transcriptional regulator [Comamonas aquatica DA1877]
MDRFDAMQAFARVVEAGSFTQAAQTLHMGRATVTQLVQQLEARLRVKLLHRTTRRLRLTEQGALYYDRVCRVLAELEEAESQLSSAAHQPRGRLRVDVPSPLAQRVLIPALPDFFARYPEIQLELGVSDRNVDLLRERVDCVLRGGSIDSPGLVARQVGSLRLGVYAAPAYLQRHGTPAHPQQLAGDGHHMVGLLQSRTGKPRLATLRLGAESVALPARYVCAVDDGNAYLAAGLAGLGVVCVPDYMAQQHVACGALQPLFADWQLPAMPLSIAYPPQRHVSAALRAFIDWVVALMAVHVPRPEDAPPAAPD